MSSDAPHRVINTRERGTSTDINRISALSDRNAILAAWYLAQNDEVVSGVLTGLNVTMSGDTVTVNPGCGLLNDTVASYPDSPYRWMEVRTGTTVTASVTGTKVTGQWMVIELTPGTTNSITTNVDVFDPTTSSFTPVSQVKEVESAPVITVTTSGVANQFPSATANRMPLAYLYDDGGTLSSNHLVHSRPLLWSKGPMQTSDATNDDPDFHRNKQWVQGGGISVAADGTTITLAAIAGRFFGHRQAFAVDKTITFDLSDANAWIGGVISITDENIYIYAVPPPYPVGYGAIADREFVVGSSTSAQFSTVGIGAAGTNQTGCILVASDTAPDDTTIGSQGATSTSLAVFDVPFRDGGASASVDGGQNVYVGAIDWASSLAKKQEFLVGESRVLLTRFPVTDVIVQQPTPDTNLNVNLRDGTSTGGATEGIVPPHATAMRIQVNVDMSSGIGGVRLASDEATWEFTVNDNIATYQQNIPIDMIQTATGSTITVRYSDAAVVEFDILTSSYTDAIIAAR